MRPCGSIDDRPLDAGALHRSCAAHVFGDIGYPRDHKAIGAVHGLTVKPTHMRIRAAAKPIGWTLVDPQAYGEEVTCVCMHRVACGIVHLPRDLCELAQRWTEPKRQQYPLPHCHSVRSRRRTGRPCEG